MSEDESVIGWACAQDWTASDYVERISVELEVYVAADARRQGVGRCLMDKLMDACDRGHIQKGGYDFVCAPEKAHLYNSGGGRDLHKLYFIVRTWSTPRKAARFGKGTAATQPDEEGELGWLKEWLASWNFEVEGVLKQAAAKNGR
jgi:hypothetical protein